VRRLLFVAGEGEGQGQRADTATVHVDRQDDLCHPIPVGTLAGRETAGGERRRSLEQCVEQLYLRFHDGEQKTRDEDERRRHHQDGGCPLNQGCGDGLVVELNVLAALHRGDDGFDDDEQRGRLDAAACGTRGSADEYRYQDQNDGGYVHRVEIQNVESGCPAGDNLKDGGEHFVAEAVHALQRVVVLQQEEQDAANDDDGERDVEDDFGLRHQRLPAVFVALADVAVAEEVADGDEPDTAEEHERHDDDLREVTPWHAEVQQAVVNQNEAAVVECRHSVEYREEEVLLVG